MSIWDSLQPWLNLARHINEFGWARIPFMLDGQQLEMYVRHRPVNRNFVKYENAEKYIYTVEGKFYHTSTFYRVKETGYTIKALDFNLSLEAGTTQEEAEEIMAIFMLQVNNVPT